MRAGSKGQERQEDWLDYAMGIRNVEPSVIGGLTLGWLSLVVDDQHRRWPKMPKPNLSANASTVHDNCKRRFKKIGCCYDYSLVATGTSLLAFVRAITD
jgi:hypothetical protein